jgi:hypothetical protein
MEKSQLVTMLREANVIKKDVYLVVKTRVAPG